MHRMSGQDAAFLYGETPAWHMHVSAVLLVRPEPGTAFDAERLRRHLIERLAGLPQFRWRVREVPLGLDRPGWVEDDSFDPDYHIRRVGVPGPGGRQELGELVGRLASYQLDRRRPLWEVWVIEGLEDGGAAVLCKVHHSIIDGVSGAGIAEVILDPTPQEVTRTLVGCDSIAGRPIPSTAEMVAKGVWNTLVRSPYRTTRFVGQSLRQAFSVLDVSRRAGRLPVTPYQAPRTVFNGRLSSARSFAWTHVDLERVKQLRRDLQDAVPGTKLNDIVLALCGTTLREYLMAHGGVPSAPLLAQCPVSLRGADDDAVGAKVGSMFTSLATHVEDPLERLRAIQRSTAAAKEMQRALAVHKIMGLTETTPPGLIALAARAYSESRLGAGAPPPVNVVISNVPGPPFALYVAGARLEGMFPMGPLLLDMGLNISVLSYCGAIDVGIMVCPTLVPDPWPIADGLGSALEELEGAAAAWRTAARSGGPPLDEAQPDEISAEAGAAPGVRKTGSRA